MKRSFSSKQYHDNAISARTGALFGIAIVILHIVHHVLTRHLPEDIHLHVLSEMAAGTLGGAILFAAGSALFKLVQSVPSFREARKNTPLIPHNPQYGCGGRPFMGRAVRSRLSSVVSEN